MVVTMVPLLHFCEVNRGLICRCTGVQQRVVCMTKARWAACQRDATPLVSIDTVFNVT